MAQFSRFNALDQILDIQGSFSQSSTRTLTDETSGFGEPLTGQTGAVANITTFSLGVSTITGLTGMTANSVGNFLTVSGAAAGGNNGTFLIISFVSATSVTISNAAGSAPDANNGAITWTERRTYCLNDDLDFERTDRAAIKGVAYDQPIPTYTRPTATGTPVAKNLSNLVSLDSKLLNNNRIFYSASVAATDTKITLSSAGNLKHASSTDLSGVPCFDVAPYVGDFTSCYAFLTDTAQNDQMVVQTGIHKGELIFGVTNNGASTSPNSVEVVFYSVPIGGNPVTGSTLYTWETGQPTTINVTYGFGERADTLSVNALRTTQGLNVVSDGDLRQDITDIHSVIGMADGDTDLSTELTNTGANFVFFNLPDATPSVVEALNTLNSQIGDRTYTGPYLTSGQTIAASLQALSNAISSSSIVRTIERLAADVNANTSHLLPGGITYTLDGTNNGRNMFVFTRGLLRDPGSVANGDDYAETNTTHITFFAKQKSGDHINYMVLA
jgi:hypothetical protein